MCASPGCSPWCLCPCTAGQDHPGHDARHLQHLAGSLVTFSFSTRPPGEPRSDVCHQRLVFPDLERHINKTVKKVHFGIWPFVLNIMCMRIIYVLVHSSSSTLLRCVPFCKYKAINYSYIGYLFGLPRKQWWWNMHTIKCNTVTISKRTVQWW